MASSHSALPSLSAAPAVAKLAAAADHDTPADADAEAYEREHVHGVYEAIAPHFSSTRYKPWPAVAQFLHARPAGSMGLDVGCGNGKYLGVNPGLVMIGSDRSPALIALAKARLESDGPAEQPDSAQSRGVSKKKGATEAIVQGTPQTSAPAATVAVATDVLVADGLSLPFRDGAADFVICIAVIHHMSTRARRQEAIRQLLSCVRSADAGGQVMVMVWALEQGGSRRGWDEGGEQDLLVPWVMKGQQKQSSKAPQPKIDDAAAAAAAAAVAAAAASKGGESPTPADAAATQHTDGVFQRYYHLYRKGELEEDVLAAGGAVVASGYERDNWWTVATNKPSPSRPA